MELLVVISFAILITLPAGIRTLPEVAGMRNKTQNASVYFLFPLLHMNIHIQQFITQQILPHIAPQSLGIDRVEYEIERKWVKSRTTREESNIARIMKENEIVKPGDLILIRTPGKFYEQARKLTRNNYDHVVVVVKEGKVLHVGPPSARLLPIERVLVSFRQPKVLLCGFVVSMQDSEDRFF